MRILTVAPDRHADVLELCDELAASGRIEEAYGCVDALIDVELLEGDADRAIATLQRFLRHGASVPALVRLVELCVDAERQAPLRAAQAALADAYLDTGHAAEARVIAEDLLAADPESEAHAQRLRLALDALGVENPDDILAGLRGEHAEAEEIPTDVIELDLSDALLALTQPAPPAPAPPAPPLEAVFEGLRARAAQEQQASGAAEQYRRGVEHLRHGRIDEGIGDLQAAARVPMFRFVASARLGRLYVDRDELQLGIDWLERAGEAPAPTPEEGFALLYDLAAALERLGESTRALAVLMELDAHAGGYRDVRARVDQLSRGQGA